MLKKKMRSIFLALVGACMIAGTGTVLADTPSDIWEYTISTNEDDSLTCTFKEVEMQLPASWTGKVGMVVSGNAVVFYHLASRQAFLDAIGEPGGKLFRIVHSQDLSFMDSDPQYTLIGKGASGIYYVSEPTDVQGYIDDAKIWEEWKTINKDVGSVIEGITLNNEEDGTVTVDELSTAIDVFSGDQNILPESSTRIYTAQELSGMDSAQLQMAINEIYARHHRKFVIPEIQAYFDAKSWYSGTVEASDFDPSVMSSVEWANITLMLKLMNGASYDSLASSVNPVVIGGADGTTAIQIYDTPAVPAAPAAPVVESSASGANVRYTTAGVNVRAQAESGSAIVAVVLENVGVAVTGEAVNGWIPVSCSGGISGYIYQDYLE